MPHRLLRRIAWVGVLLGISLLAIDAVAGRGRGGGGRGGGRGNISRSGPAMGGSMRHSGTASRGGFGGSSRGSRERYGGSNRPSTGMQTRPSQGDRRPSQGDRRPSQGDRRPGQDGSNDRFDDRQDGRNDRQEDRQDHITDRQEDRQKYGNNARNEYYEHHGGYSEFYEDRWKYALGASLTAATFRALTCTPTTVIVGGVSYYQCGSSWYNRAYSGGSTTYVVINAPPGY